MKKQTLPPIPEELLAQHPLVQIAEDYDAAVKNHGQKLEAEFYTALADHPEDCSNDDAIRQESAALRLASRRLLDCQKRTLTLADELDARQRDARHSVNGRWFSRHPSNATIDSLEHSGDHFAEGINGYKLGLILILGSFLGVVIELIWCLLRNGYIESRSGLVWGPFNLLYGAGAVALSLCLYRFRNRGSWLSFLGGFVVGSILEYACSWGQEMLLGSVSWDYSAMPFNLNGRICLLYSIFWGFLGVFWIKNVFPRMSRWILKLPNRAGKLFTTAMLIFLLINSAMSCITTYRWSERVHGTATSGSTFWEYIDQHYPDTRMEHIFANMEFGE